MTGKKLLGGELKGRKPDKDPWEKERRKLVKNRGENCQRWGRVEAWRQLLGVKNLKKERGA